MNALSILTALSIIIIPICGLLKLNPPVWYGQYIGMIFCLLLGISLWLWKFNKYLSIFTIVCLFNTFFIARFAPRAMLLLFQLYFCCVAIYGISQFDKKQRRCVLYGILTIFGLSCIYLVVQYFNKDPYLFSMADPKKDELVAFFGAKDQLGTFFALTLPVVYYCHPVLILFSLIGLFIARSSFAFVSAISGLGIYLILFERRKLKFFVIGLFIIMILFFKYGDRVRIVDFQTRGLVWQEVVVDTSKGRVNINNNDIVCNPLFGYGFGNFLNIFPHIEGKSKGFNYSNEKFTHAHNDYVEAFFDLGRIGIVSLIVLLFNFVYGFIKAKKSKELCLYFSCIVVYLLNATGNFLTHLAVSGAFLIIFVGLYEATRKELNG